MIALDALKLITGHHVHAATTAATGIATPTSTSAALSALASWETALETHLADDAAHAAADTATAAEFDAWQAARGNPDVRVRLQALAGLLRAHCARDGIHSGIDGAAIAALKDAQPNPYRSDFEAVGSLVAALDLHLASGAPAEA